MVDLELIALVASRICHDLVSPVGAIANGVEILSEEGGGGDIEAQALDLIAGSALQASRRLAFCRLAFGAGGGPEALLDARDAATATSDFLQGGKIACDWLAGPPSLPRNAVKVALLFVLAGADCLARGGRLTVGTAHEGTRWQIHVTAMGDRLTVHPALGAALEGRLSSSEIDAKLAPSVYAGHLARMLGGRIELVTEAGQLQFRAEIRR